MKLLEFSNHEAARQQGLKKEAGVAFSQAPRAILLLGPGEAPKTFLSQTIWNLLEGPPVRWGINE